MIEYCVYKIENIVNKKSYIGSSVNFSKRALDHATSLKCNKHHSIYLQRAYNKYGAENFTISILEYVFDPEFLIEREQFYIDRNNSEYNICKIAGSSLGIKRRPETKEKIRQANLGLKHSQERNDKKSKAQGGDKHWTKNKKFSKEAKIKMSNSHKKLYENGYINPRKGKKNSKEHNIQNREKNFVPIIQLSMEGDLLKEWDSPIIVEETLGIWKSNIVRCCKKHVNSAGKFKWMYKKDYKESSNEKK